MSNALRCDRCKKSGQLDDVGGPEGWVHFPTFPTLQPNANMVLTVMHERGVDLCPSCVYDLGAWLSSARQAFDDNV